MPTLSLATFSELDVSTSQVITLLTRTRIRVTSASSPFCSVQESSVWFPLPDDVNPDSLPQPAVITNSNPVPANAVVVPPDFNDTDLCYIFQDLVRDSEPVYAEEDASTYILAPFTINYSLLGVTRTSISIREYPYELTLPGESIAAVTRSVIHIPTYIFSLESGTFTVTGQASNFNINRKSIGAAAAFTLTGASSGFTRGYVVVGAAGSYALAGQAATTIYQRNQIAADAGAFVLQGQNAQWFLGKTLFADAGSFAAGGEAAGLLRSRLLPAGLATFSVNGQDATVASEDFFTSWAEQTYVDSWLDVIDWWAE